MEDTIGVSMDEFRMAIMEGHLFFQGLSINYGPSNLVTKPDHVESEDGKDKMAVCTSILAETFGRRQALATGLPVGMRFNSFKVSNRSANKRFMPK